MSYSRDTFNDLVWDSDTSTYVAAPLVCERDTTIDIKGTGLDPDTIYNVTDQQLDTLAIFKKIYDVGSLYFGMMDVCPLAALFGTWVKISNGRVIQGATPEHPAGTTAEAGLPNITGSFRGTGQNSATEDSYEGGAFKAIATTTAYSGASGNDVKTWQFDASLSNPIYGASNTVQPPSFFVNIWQRIA